MPPTCGAHSTLTSICTALALPAAFPPSGVFHLHATTLLKPRPHGHGFDPHGRCQLMRVNSANVLDEGLRIGGRGRQINSKVKISQTRRGLVCTENKRGTQLAQSQSVTGRPLLAPIYRWPDLEGPVGFNTNYNVCTRHHLVFDYIYV
jgi:hypothetical protein